MKFYKVGFFAIKVVVKIPLSEKILTPPLVSFIHHTFWNHYVYSTWEYTMRITGLDNYSNKVEIRELEDIEDGEGGGGIVSRATLGSKP